VFSDERITESITPWTIRLDGRTPGGAAAPE